MRQNAWHFWIDRGSTFTDVLGRAPDGTLHAQKVLLDAREGRDAAVMGIRALMGLSRNEIIPAGSIAEVRAGTTLALNALVEGRGMPAALLITRGFPDLLRIGRPAPTSMFAAGTVRPDRLCRRVVEINERVLADGTVECPLNIEEACAALEAVEADGCESVAIVFMHGNRFPAHEAQVAAIAREMFFPHVSVSHEIAPGRTLVDRGFATVADACAAAALNRFATQLLEELDPARTGTRVLFMNSAGRLADAGEGWGTDAIFPAPAAAMQAMAEDAAEAGLTDVITLDIGATSAKAALMGASAGRKTAKGCSSPPDARIETVPAGGCSVLTNGGGVFHIGPESAGANPGPACFARGGPLTLTDAQVMTGRLVPECFPAIFGASGREELDTAAAAAKFNALAASDSGRTPEDMAEAFLQAAARRIADAVHAIPALRGQDLNPYSLSASGSAAGQIACRLADALGVRTVVFPPWSGLMTAYGLGMAELSAAQRHSVGMPLEDTALGRIAALAVTAGGELRAGLRGHGLSALALTTRVSLTLRYGDTGADMEVPAFTAEGVAAIAEAAQTMSTAALQGAFETAHAARFGFIENKAVTVAAVCVEVTGNWPRNPVPVRLEDSGAPLPRHGVTRLYADGVWHEAAIYLREQMKRGQTADGPALVIGKHLTVVVEPGWRAQVTGRRHLAVERMTPAAASEKPPPLDVFNGRLAAITAGMGEVLESAAASVSLRSQQDFACAIFDDQGRLLAHAPHSPVHAGAMEGAVAHILSHETSVRPGDVFASNATCGGGPGAAAVTVCTPVHGGPDGEVLFWAAACGHHDGPHFLTAPVDDNAPAAKHFKLVDAGIFREADLPASLARARYPMHNLAETAADLKAQAAATAAGAEGMRRMIGELGAEALVELATKALDHAAERVRLAISSLGDGASGCPRTQGSVIRVRIGVNPVAGEATVDFTGTSEVGADGLNAPLPVTRAAVMHAFWLLAGADFPMNAGCLRPVRVIVPEGCLLSPGANASAGAAIDAVAQAAVNCLAGALGMRHGAADTVSSLLLRSGRAQCHETLGPLHSAAGPLVTSARPADPELLESRLPLVVEDCRVVSAPGAAEPDNASAGVSRTFRTRERMECTAFSPRSTVRRGDGSKETLLGCVYTVLEAGEAITVVSGLE